MGRWSTGAITHKEALRLELSHLVKAGYLVKGATTRGHYRWYCNGRESSNIVLISRWTEEEKYIRLIYTTTDGHGEKYDYDYKIDLVTVPSNLGKGEVLYFLCPVSWKRCRVLYCAYGYHKWKSREAYQNRIFYESQTQSKLNRANSKYWELKKKVEAILQEKYLRLEYDGKPTKKALYLEKLKRERDFWDTERWKAYNMPKAVRGIFGLAGFTSDERIF